MFVEDVPDASLDEVLAHYGVRGMKWGTHRSGSSNSGESGGRRPHLPKFTKKKATSTEVVPSSHDAARANELKTRVQSGGTRSLSNQELQHLVSRMNLEQQYSKLSNGGDAKTSGVASKGKKFAADILVQVAKQQASKYLNDQVGELIKKQTAKA